MQRNSIGMKKDESCIPWSEKYRPLSIENIVLEENNRKLFTNILEKDRFPHLLFYGPPGVGKTTSSVNLVKMYQELHHRRNSETIIHLNASDERGVEVIRNQIHQFVKCNNMFESGYKFVILDEVDYMTKIAQQALKNLLQTCNDNVRFCLICNYICKIEDSLKNEFICIRFNQLPEGQVLKFIRNIANSENLKISDETISNIQKMFQSDIRAMINFLQLHQNEESWDLYVIHNVMWEELYTLFRGSDHKKTEKWIMEKTIYSGNMDIKKCMANFFHFLITKHPEHITPTLLNIAETLLHPIETNEFMLTYFVSQVHRSLLLKN